MKEPMVSIIVPTFKRELELKKALDSLGHLEYDFYEIIVVDDNADVEWNKQVENIVKRFREENPILKVLHIVNKQNMGSAKTRNIGIDAACGEYVCFLDDDDIYLPQRIRNQVTAMQGVDADYSITDLALYSEKGNLIEIRKRDYIRETSYSSLLQYHLMYHMTGTDTLMFKREYLIKIGGFAHIDVGDEFYLMLRAIEHKGKFLYVPTCDVKAFVHTGEGGLSSGEGKINGENQLYKFKKKYFSDLGKEAVRYIKMRHHIVLAFAYLRMKKFYHFGIESVKALCVSPRGLFELWNKRQ